MSIRNLLYCPKCKLDAKDKVIGELLPGGTVAIARQRAKYSYEETTLVTGTDFQLICGYCRSVIYIKQEPKEVVSYGATKSSNFRTEWVHRITFSQGSVRQELQSSAYNAGTPLFA